MAKKIAFAEKIGGERVILAADVAAVDASAEALGVSGQALMRRAGVAVARAAIEMGAPCEGEIVVLAGPGKNGGDGYVAAAALSAAQRAVRVVAAAEPSAGDAAAAAAQWREMGGAVEPWSAAAAQRLANASLIIDSLFGVGLSRPLEGRYADLIAAANASAAPVLAVDIPSGVACDSGVALGPAIRADATVTFVARKPCHLLAPGAQLSGAVRRVDILEGVEAAADSARSDIFALNAVQLGSRLRKAADAHKFQHGSALVAAGGFGASGAARLSATAALRVGAGLVTVAAPAAAAPECAAQLTAVMLRVAERPEDFGRLLEDGRINAVLIGPGHATHPEGAERTRAFVMAAMAAPVALVLDADALTAFSSVPDVLFAAIQARAGETVLTPHSGEFARLFPTIAHRWRAEGDLSKIDAVRAAAALSGAVVLLKGPDTVVADPKGGVAVASAFATPEAAWLATAGSGDVLAGLIVGLAARGRPAAEAAGDAAVLHVEAARCAGAGLIADDLAAAVSRAIRALA